MTLGNIAKRYAKALYLYATECKVEERVYEQAYALCRTMAHVPDLSRALLNPVVELPAKLSLLHNSVGGRMNDALVRFIELLFHNHRERYLMFILASFIAHYRHQKHIYVGRLTTSIPMDAEVEEQLRAMLSQITQGGRVEFDTKVDKSIIGGFILQLDNQRMDASVKGQLRQIKAELMR